MACPAGPWAGYAIATLAVLFSLRRDRELSYVVTLMATVLLSPLLWDHYLSNLLVPAAFVAGRGRLWALGLPLLAWAPQLLTWLLPGLGGIADGALPLVALAGLLLPFAVADRGLPAGSLLGPVQRRLATGPVRA